jgi:hypothetical protein
MSTRQSEVKGCDIFAVPPAEPLTIVEMKFASVLGLLLQATDRIRTADEVWVAVPATRRKRPDYRCAPSVAPGLLVSWWSAQETGPRCSPSQAPASRVGISAGERGC